VAKKYLQKHRRHGEMKIKLKRKAKRRHIMLHRSNKAAQNANMYRGGGYEMIIRLSSIIDNLSVW